MTKTEISVGEQKIALIYELSKALPIVSLRLVWSAAGVASTKPALAKMAAKILNEGTKKSPNKFISELENRAIELRALAGFETFNIELSCLKEHFSYAFKSLIELLNSPNLTQSTLDRLKVEAIGKIAAKKSDLDYQANLLLNRILYPKTAKSRPSIGEPRDIEDISLDDIKEFLAQKLDLANLFIVLGGDIEGVDFSALKTVLNAGQKRELKGFKTSDKQIIKTIKRPTKQAYIYFGSPLLLTKEQKYLATTAAFILGSSGFGSRLLEQIRVKRGLAYSAYCRCEFALTHQALTGYLQTKNESASEAIAVVKDEIAKLINSGATQAELDAAKNFILGSEPLSKETLFKRLNIASSEHYFGYELGEFERNLERVKALNLATLNSFIASKTELNKLSFAIINE